MKITIALWSCVFCLAPSPSFAQGEGNQPELFGYTLGQRIEIAEITEHRLHGVVAADSDGLPGGLDELLLTVTPKTYTIVSISGSVRTEGADQISSLEDRWWSLLTTKFKGWKRQRLKVGGIDLWNSQYWIQVGAERTQTEGIFDFSVSLKYSPGSQEWRALEALRKRETQQIIADHQSSGR